MLNSQETRIYRNVYDRLKSREITFHNTGKILLKAEFSDGLQISMNIKDITIPLIIHYYLLRAFRTLQIFPLNHNVGFFRVSTRGVGIMQYVYALNPVCIVLIIPGHSREKFPVRAVDIVNPGIQ